jgi:hypothetical protein
VFTPTCHDVVVDCGFEICDAFGHKRFFDLLRKFIVQVESAPTKKEALLVVGKVLQTWEGLDPPGRFLQCSGGQGSGEASEWVIASFRTSVRVTFRCFKSLDSAGQIEAAESGCQAKSNHVGGEVRKNSASPPMLSCFYSLLTVCPAIKDLPTVQSLNTAKGSSFEYLPGPQEGISKCGSDDEVNPKDLDVLVGRGVHPHATEGTRCFREFVESFFPEYKRRRGHQQSLECDVLDKWRSSLQHHEFWDKVFPEYEASCIPLPLARKVLVKWRTSFEHQGDFLVRSDKGWVTLTDDECILDNILDRWRELQAAAREERASFLWVRQKNVATKRTCTRPSQWPSKNHDASSLSTSILARLAVIREAVECNVPVSAQERNFYRDTTAAGLGRSDTTGLCVRERLALFHLAWRHGLELTKQESKLLDQFVD